MNATQIISALSAARVRATYGAVAQVLGIPPRAVSGLLGTRRPETSWVVSARTGLPTGYLPHEMHENFGTNSRILCSGGELTEFLSKSVPTGDPKHTTSDAAQLVGVDLAWNCEKNGTGIAIGAHDGKNLTVATVYTNVVGLDVIQNLIVATPNAKGVAIDAPLIIKNSKGSRPCEKDLTGTFGSRWAGCHPSNLQRHANSAGPRLAGRLEQAGFHHLGVREGKWQIECYPHPAMVEIFELDKRLKYKKKRHTSWDEVRSGQARLGELILSLANSESLSLSIPHHLQYLMDPTRIAELTVRQLKENEDGLDAIICLYIAGLYFLGAPGRCFGDKHTGYIWVPS